MAQISPFKETPSPSERKEMIKQSFLAVRLTHIKSSAGWEHFMDDSNFSQTEKDYILFNMHDLERISKMRIHEFYAEVEKHKEDMNNVED